MDYQVEVELQYKGNQSFYDDCEPYNLFQIIEAITKRHAPVDCLVVYLSKDDDLVQLWELPTDRESAPTKLVQIAEEISKIINKGGKHDFKKTHCNSSHPDSAIR